MKKQQRHAINRKKYQILTVVLPIALVLIIVSSFSVRHWQLRNDPLTPVFSTLERIRISKEKQAYRFFNALSKKAYTITRDPKMTGYFTRLLQHHTGIPSTLEYEIDKHYAYEYSSFYDILFVDTTGFVFYSIRKEADYHRNILRGEFAETKLALALQKNADRFFVEYELYKPSSEPASFFTVQVFDGKNHIGWFVLQCAINQINIILTDRDKLGQTGEVYLVNSDSKMITESRFTNDCTILKQKVNTKAVEMAFKKGNWKGIIDDYRGKKVLSSSSRFKAMNINWVIISEIDESEVFTSFYKKYKKHIRPALLSQFQSFKVSGSNTSPQTGFSNRVDVNEFMKSKNDTLLKTYGVSTCTGMSILLPDSSAYLVHMSPTDRSYNNNPITRLFLGNNSYNLLGEIIHRIKHYDIYLSQMQNVNFYIVSTHKESFDYTVEKLVESGIHLSNIHFAYNPDASSANVVVNPEAGKTFIEWVYKSRTTHTTADNYSDLETAIKKLISYERKVKSLGV